MADTSKAEGVGLTKLVAGYKGAFELGRRSILDRLNNPDEAMLLRAHVAGTSLNQRRAICRALAAVLDQDTPRP